MTLLRNLVLCTALGTASGGIAYALIPATYHASAMLLFRADSSSPYAETQEEFYQSVVQRLLFETAVEWHYAREANRGYPRDPYSIYYDRVQEEMALDVSIDLRPGGRLRQRLTFGVDAADSATAARQTSRAVALLMKVVESDHAYFQEIETIRNGPDGVALERQSERVRDVQRQLELARRVTSSHPVAMRRLRRKLETESAIFSERLRRVESQMPPTINDGPPRVPLELKVIEAPRLPPSRLGATFAQCLGCGLAAGLVLSLVIRAVAR